MQARENPRTEIGETVYELELWTVSDCFSWQEKLMNLGLEPVAMFLSGSADGEQRWDSLEEAEYPVIARTILTNLGAEGVAKTIKKLLAGAHRVEARSGGEVLEPVTGSDYEHRYKGQTMHLYTLAGWVIVENLQDFMFAARLLEKALRSSLSSGLKNESEEEPEEPEEPSVSPTEGESTP